MSLLNACNKPRIPVTDSPETVSVVATVYPLQYLVQRVGGDRVSVATLVPTGVEPHAWEPSPGDIASIYASDLFVYNGIGLEQWAERVLADLLDDGTAVVIASSGITLRKGTKDGLSGTDPHVWLDPRRYAEEANHIRKALIRIDPDGADLYTTNFLSLHGDLLELEQEFANALAVCTRRTVVVPHTAFGYLTDRLHLEQLAIAGLSPEVEPSPTRLRAIIEEVRRLGTTHVFFEALARPRLAETVAAELGIQLLLLHPVSGLTLEENASGADYFSLMRLNLANLRTALDCQ